MAHTFGTVRQPQLEKKGSQPNCGRRHMLIYTSLAIRGVQSAVDLTGPGGFWATTFYRREWRGGAGNLQAPFEL